MESSSKQSTELASEIFRLKSLYSFGILDTPQDSAFDDITALAAQIFDVPIAMISLVDFDRQWFKAKVGLDETETPRVGSFCDAAIRSNEVFVVSDATQDPMFAQHPMVAGAAAIRFYAGAPLIAEDGSKLGTFCLIDQKERTFTSQQQKLLTLLSSQVINLLILRKNTRDLHSSLEEMQKLNDELNEAQVKIEEGEKRLLFAMDSAKIGDWNMDLRTNVAVRSLQHDQCFGYETEVAQWGYDTFLAHVHKDDRERVDRIYATAMSGRGDYDVEFRVIWPDGSEHWLWSRGRFYFDESGEACRVAGIQADITERRKTEEKIYQVEQRTRRLLRASTVGLWEWDLATDEVYFSAEWKLLLGYDDHEIVNRFEEWQKRIHPQDIDRVMTALDDFRHMRTTNYNQEIRMLHRDGTWRWTLNSAEVQCNVQGLAVMMMGSQIEINKQKVANMELMRFKEVLDSTLDMIFMFDPMSLRFVYLNRGAVQSMGFSQEEMLGMTPYQIKPLLSEYEFRQMVAPLLSKEIPSLHFETLHRRKDGHEFPVAIYMQLVQQSDGSELFVAIVHDITEKKLSEDLIWKQANFDNLTGLPNRRMFYNRLEQEIKKPQRSGLPVALLLLDLDHFKEVNDSLGHAQGDALLVEAARRISHCVRESDTVARFGGDEFTIVLSDMEDVSVIEHITQNILERLVAPFQLLQETVYVSASVGITLFPNDAQDIETLMKNADQAMYLSKSLGRDRFSYFTADLQEAAQTRLRLLNDLRNALAENQLSVHYQPIIKMNTGNIVKAEALLRWQHPALGMVSPAQFIPLAEDSGLIHEIGDWVFRESARTLKRWRELFNQEFQVSVNVSPVQFRKVKTKEKSAWVSYLNDIDLPGHSLVIEITEGLLLNGETSVNEKLLAYSHAGIQVALDDFGTGYSSLSYLKKFDIDFLKIDQSFVRNLEHVIENRGLCEAIIVMAHKLGLRVIAEGVETEQQRDLLLEYGCDYAQGWFYSKALPLNEFETIFTRSKKLDVAK